MHFLTWQEAAYVVNGCQFFSFGQLLHPLWHAKEVSRLDDGTNKILEHVGSYCLAQATLGANEKGPFCMFLIAHKEKERSKIQLYSAGDVATFAADDLRPLQKVKGAHMVFTTALTFSQDEECILTVSADASALATKVSKTAASSPLQLYFVLALLALVFAIICALFMLRSGKASASEAMSQQASYIQAGAQRHADLNQEL